MKNLLLLVTFLIICGFGYSQTLVNPGDGTLSAAIASANSGDVLQLIDGAEYTEGTNFDLGTIDKEITIEAVGASEDMPVIKITASDGTSTPNFFPITEGGSITLKGLEFDGSQNGSPAVSHLIQFDAGDPPAETNIGNIKILDCIIHDLAGNVVDAGNSEIKGFVIIDSIFVDNSIMYNTATPLYLKYSGENYLSVTNSTFYNIISYGIRVSGSGESGLTDKTPVTIIDHTTWYNVGIDDPREIILLEKAPNPTNSWTVTNSIFQKQVSGLGKTVVNLKELDDSVGTISNIAYWDIGDVNWRNNIVHDTLRADPEFADPDNGDFTLPESSPLFTFGTDGGPIGDPRWTKNATDIDEILTQPKTFSLNQNFPNPFNPSTKITFILDRSGFTSLKVYNLIGQEIATLIKGSLTAGSHEISFNAADLPSGVYIYRLTSGSKILSKKMVLLK